MDEYLADCEGMGISPHKLAIKAADEGLELNKAVQRAVEKFVVAQ